MSEILYSDTPLCAKRLPTVRRKPRHVQGRPARPLAARRSAERLSSSQQVPLGLGKYHGPRGGRADGRWTDATTGTPRHAPRTPDPVSEDVSKKEGQP